jgi:hypothetical protein
LRSASAALQPDTCSTENGADGIARLFGFVGPGEIDYLAARDLGMPENRPKEREDLT